MYIVYSKPNCTYCTKVKGLLKQLELPYEEKMFGKDFTSPEQLFEAVGKQVRTMPQVMYGDKLIGGYTDLREHLINEGKINFQGEIKE